MIRANWLTLLFLAATLVLTVYSQHHRHSASHCAVEVKNSGSYVLKVTYEGNDGEDKVMDILEGQRDVFSSRRNSLVKLHAVAGDTTSHSVPEDCPSTGDFPLQIECKGTTWVGFRCDIKPDYTLYHDRGYDGYSTRIRDNKRKLKKLKRRI